MDSDSVKKAIIRQVLAESSKANSQQLFQVSLPSYKQRHPANPCFDKQKVNEHCFDKCIAKPGSSISSSETTCVTQCMEKYIATWNQVNSALVRRLQQEVSNNSFST